LESGTSHLFLGTKGKENEKQAVRKKQERARGKDTKKSYALALSCSSKKMFTTPVFSSVQRNGKAKSAAGITSRSRGNTKQTGDRIHVIENALEPAIEAKGLNDRFL
jgi:hypothetical protein